MEGNFGPFFLQTGKIEYEVCGGKEIEKGRKKTIFKNKFNRNTFAQRQSFIEKNTTRHTT